MNEILEYPVFPSDEQLIETYIQKEEIARKRILDGRFDYNPNIRDPRKDSRYSISTCHFPYPNTVTAFLSGVINSFNSINVLCVQQPEYVHITTGEVAYKQDNGGRKALGINSAEKVKQYYKALADHLPVYEPTPNLPFWKIIPIMDNPDSSSSSFTIAATFLTGKSDTAFRIMHDIKKAFDDYNNSQNSEENKLPYSARLSNRDALLVAIARPPKKPTPRQVREILKIIDMANSSVPNCCDLSLNDITMLSTFRYVPSTRHAYLDPPIDLTTSNRDTSNIRILTPDGFAMLKKTKS